MAVEPPTYQNNFDLVRLAAAAQVAIIHVADDRIDIGWLGDLLSIFPGVPIFFFVSGFLVSGSWERSRDLRKYARNRALRIFPALWVCLAVSLAMAALFVPIPIHEADFWIWIAAHLSMGQFYNPEFLRPFGLGVLNGSLWTIPVEIQFYIALPLIYALISRLGGMVIYVIAAAAIAFHSYFIVQWFGSDITAFKLINVSFLPWIGFFLIGVIAQRNWGRISRFFVGRAGYWLAAYVGIVLLFSLFPGLAINGRSITAPYAFLLFGFVLSAAYTAPHLANRLLRGNDISYGLYLYHLPVLNLALSAKLTQYMPAPLMAVGVFATAAALATLSWFFVERPALSFKSRAATRAARRRVRPLDVC